MENSLKINSILREDIFSKIEELIIKHEEMGSVCLRNHQPNTPKSEEIAKTILSGYISQPEFLSASTRILPRELKNHREKIMLYAEKYLLSQEY